MGKPIKYEDQPTHSLHFGVLFYTDEPHYSGRTWTRSTKYVPDSASALADYNDCIYDTLFVAGKDDASAPQRGYNGDCSCCFLNIFHSQEMHQQELTTCFVWCCKQAPHPKADHRR